MNTDDRKTPNDPTDRPVADTEPSGEETKSKGVPKKWTPTPKNPRDVGPLSPDPVVK